MTSADTAPAPVTSVEEILKGWHELVLRVGQLEAERTALEQANKALRFLLERSIDHREKSHGELVMLLTGLVSKLPINDVGLVVSKLVEHNARVGEACAALTKGKVEADLPQPAVLKAMDQAKRDLLAALKPAVEELLRLDSPLETSVLQALPTQPDLFFSPGVVRATRCYLKGQIARERVMREFGEDSLAFFNDLTTDPKLNPRPKAEEIVLAFKPDFEALAQQIPAANPEQRQKLVALHQRVTRGKTSKENARAERCAFQRLSFLLELLHYYENQNTEAIDVVFAQRMPALIEQLVLTGPQDKLEEKSVAQAEALLAHVVQPDHRLMIINNLGKGGGSARTLKFVLRLRVEKTPDEFEVAQQFVKHFMPSTPGEPLDPKSVTPFLKLIHPEMQRVVVGAILSFDKVRRDEAEAFGRAVGKELGLSMAEVAAKTTPVVSPEMERQLAWENVKDLLAKRGSPAAIASAIRDRLHAKYDGDEVKQSWVLLTEADPMSLIRVFCHLPYLPDGSSDVIARPVMEAYVQRLTHEKYAPTLVKVVNSLKNMYKVKADSPTLVNFLTLVRWVDAGAADRMTHEIGIAAPPQLPVEG